MRKLLGRCPASENFPSSSLGLAGALASSLDSCDPNPKFLSSKDGTLILAQKNKEEEAEAEETQKHRVMSRQAATTAFHKSKTLDNKYMLGDEIGKGAYGRVYKGLDLENGDFVAIKQVSLENIAQEDLNIIMVLEGLVYLHEQGVIHRDIKGANILTTKEKSANINEVKSAQGFVLFVFFKVEHLRAAEFVAIFYCLKPQGPLAHRFIIVTMLFCSHNCVQGLVKLADFGVATKLTEADVNTHSVVGTPILDGPRGSSLVPTDDWSVVIEMSGVCAASDIWSVGCTVIEMLTCVPPYYDLQPMPSLPDCAG
ncbi:hypothetical protein GQ457_04G005040 [Hibiscus cannabinus]